MKVFKGDLRFEVVL